MSTRARMLVFLLFLSGSIAAQELTPVKTGGKYGYRQSGPSQQLIIPAQYEYATDFKQGLALVKQNGLWGFIDPKGVFAVEPVYTNAQPFLNGLAYVFQGNKWGAVDTTGKILMKPVYDKIEENYNVYFVYSGNLIGICDKKGHVLFEPAYQDVTVQDNQVYCGKRPDGKYDVFVKDKKIAEGIKTPIDYYTYNYQAKVLLMEKGGSGTDALKKGLYHVDKGWVVQPEYDYIIQMPFFQYSMDEQDFNYLYRLEYKEMIVIDEVEVARPSTFRLAKPDGTLISPTVFTSFDGTSEPQYPDTATTYQFHTANSTTILYPNLGMREVPYIALQPHLDWIIARRAQGADVVDSDFKVLGSFDAVREITHEDSTILEGIYDYYGTEMYEVGFSTDSYIPALIVSRYGDAGYEDAIFQLEEKRLVSPYIRNLAVEIQMEGSTDTYGYVYGERKGQMKGFYFPGMETGTGLNYIQNVTFGRNKTVITGVPGETENPMILFRIENGKLKKIAEAWLIEKSSDLNAEFEIQNQMNADPEIQNQMSGTITTLALFNSEFYVLKAASGLFGFVCENEKVIPCEYDAIIQNTSNPHFIDLYKHEFYNAVDLRTGDQMAEFIADHPMRVEYDESNNLYFTRIETPTESYNIDKKGRYPDLYDFRVFKENGKAGGKVIYAVGNEEKEMIMVPARYKSIVMSSDEHFYQVKNAENKVGMISPRGDIVVPVVYDKLQNYYLKINEQTAYITTTKSGTGLVSPYRGEIVPAIYDSWEEIKFLSDTYLGILVRKGTKRGLYSYNGEMLLPCIYDNILLPQNRSVNTEQGGHFLVVQKNGKWYTMNYETWISQNIETLADPWTSHSIVDTNNFQGPFDFMINTSGYAVSADGTMQTELVNGAKTWIPAADRTGIYFQEDYLSIYEEKGKIGMRNGEQRNALKPTGTCIMLVDADTFVIPDKGENYVQYIGSGKRFPIANW